MWAFIFLTSFILHLVSGGCEREGNPALSHFEEDLGTIRFHAQTGDLPEERDPLKKKEKTATHRTKSFVNHIITNWTKEETLKLGSLGPYHIDLEDIEIWSNLTLNNFSATGLRNLSLPSFEVRVAPLLIDFNASIPKFVIEADFKLDTTVESAEHIFGRLSVKITDLAVTSTLGFKKNLSYLLDAVDVGIEMKNVQVMMDINKFSDESKTLIVNFFKDSENDIRSEMVSRMIEFIDKRIEKIPPKFIERILFGKSAPKQRQKTTKPSSRRRRERKHGHLNKF